MVLLMFVSFTEVSCSSMPSVEKYEFSTKNVIHDSRDSFVTFEFEIPEGWIACEDYGYRSIKAFPEDMAESVNSSNDYDLILGINCYRETSGDLLFEERIAAIEELLKGNGQSYEEFTKENAGKIDKDIVAGDFEFEFYNGYYGKISVVKYTVTYPEKYSIDPQNIIRCYREDIPYMVTGTFHRDDTLSSGDIALWAANTLKVTGAFYKKGRKNY